MFIIHLKRAKKRRAYVDEIISKLNIETEIIDAVDGRLLTENKILASILVVVSFFIQYSEGISVGLEKKNFLIYLVPYHLLVIAYQLYLAICT